MGAVDAARTDRLALTALGAYMVGLLCVGIAMTIYYEASRLSYENFNNAAGEFYLRRMGWNEVFWRSARTVGRQETVAPPLRNGVGCERRDHVGLSCAALIPTTVFEYVQTPQLKLLSLSEVELTRIWPEQVGQ